MNALTKPNLLNHKHGFNAITQILKSYFPKTFYSGISTGFIILMFTGLILGCGGGSSSPDTNPSTTDTYTVTYDDNGATGGNVPVDSNNYEQGDTVTVLDNTATVPLSNTGYNFAGWSTSSSGPGSDYDAGDTFIMQTADVTLYAIWELAPVPCTVTYNSNGASGTPPTDSTIYYSGDNWTILGTIDADPLANTGYTFAGWNTQTDGSGITYVTGTTLFPGTANINLYPVWIPNALTFTTNMLPNDYLGSRIIITGPNTVTGALTIPGGVTDIANNAFVNATGLTSVTITTNGNYISIGQNAFQNCTGLLTVTLPSTVSSIGGNAFLNCASLSSFTIPAGVHSINAGVFDGCSSLASVTIHDGVTSISGFAFRGCTSLTSITIPDDVTYIGGNAFDGSGLTSVTIPSGVTTISAATFQNCTGLATVTLPSTVTSIGNAAFSGCTILNNVTIHSGTIGATAFANCTGLINLTISSGVTSIGSSAFQGCTGLSIVTLPSTVTSIGTSAFTGCSALTDVYIGATTPPALAAASNAFLVTTDIHVPNGYLADYQNATGSAIGWQDYNASGLGTLVSP